MPSSSWRQVLLTTLLVCFFTLTQVFSLAVYEEYISSGSLRPYFLSVAIGALIISFFRSIPEKPLIISVILAHVLVILAMMVYPPFVGMQLFLPLVGLIGGGILPAVGTIVTNWVHPAFKGKIWGGVFFVMALLLAYTTQSFSTWIASFGWHPLGVFFLILNLCMLAVVHFFVQIDPLKQSWLSAEEKEFYIVYRRKSLLHDMQSVLGGDTYEVSLHKPSFFSTLYGLFSVGVMLYFMIVSAAQHLEAAYVSIESQGSTVWASLSSFGIGCLLIGLLIDLKRFVERLHNVQPAWIFALSILGSISLAGVILIRNLHLVYACLVLGSIAFGGVFILLFLFLRIFNVQLSRSRLSLYIALVFFGFYLAGSMNSGINSYLGEDLSGPIFLLFFGGGIAIMTWLLQSSDMSLDNFH